MGTEVPFFNFSCRTQNEARLHSETFLNVDASGTEKPEREAAWPGQPLRRRGLQQRWCAMTKCASRFLCQSAVAVLPMSRCNANAKPDLCHRRRRRGSRRRGSPVAFGIFSYPGTCQQEWNVDVRGSPTAHLPASQPATDRPV
jgi:hypothetical protein